METLSCDGLYKEFDGTQAIAGVSLRFPETGFTALIGPNGAGKTTLFNILTGFVRPDAGRCFLRGAEITQLAPYQIARLGIARTFQEPRLIFQLSALDNILLARPNHYGESLGGALLRLGVAKEESRNESEALELLDSINLKEAASEPARNLSYGQQKLLNLACCVATGARILLLDEPVTGVHPEVASRILRLIQQYLEWQRLVIFIEHDIHIVHQVAEHVIVMDSGKVVAQGDAMEVLKRHEIMEAYLG
jgi:ABC-type branched-subunit amino acid transport system ATPase component